MFLFSTETKDWLRIISSLFLAVVLMFLCVPSGISEWIYPPWLILVALYWIWFMPQRVSIGIAWLVGVLLDILYNVPVGEYALALVLAAYFIVKFSAKIESLGFWEKNAVVFGLITWCQLLPWLMQVFLGKYFNFWPIFSRAMVGALVWLIIVFWFNRQRKSHFENYY
jgi:rod shape-determining protein MreD